MIHERKYKNHCRDVQIKEVKRIDSSYYFYYNYYSVDINIHENLYK